ncbi:MAG: DUF1203 domain-containing protein, partial [Mycobacteriales bacterium]
MSAAHAALGEELLLLNHAHQPANTPYRSTDAICIRWHDDRALDAIDTVPEVLASRRIAVRAFDARHMKSATLAAMLSFVVPAHNEEASVAAAVAAIAAAATAAGAVHEIIVVDDASTDATAARAAAAGA